jgi:hypothetical protein
MRKYLLLLFILTATLFPVVTMTYGYQWSDYQILIKGLMNSNNVWFFGNSVIKHASKCDNDSRSVAQMFAAETEGSVIDMSRGGMTIDRMLDITEILSYLGVKPKAVYFQIALGGDFLAELNNTSGLEDYFYSNLNLSKKKLGFESEHNAEKVSFNGQYYGHYADFSKTNFITEKKQTVCPERMGVNQNFIAFMYWRNFLDKNISNQLISNHRLLKLKQSEVNAVFWVSPVDYEDISFLHGEAKMQEINAYKQNILEAMEGFELLDFSFKLPANSFADRWCACGHLNEKGRRFVATKLSAIRKK